jgi:hypothetical protein
LLPTFFFVFGAYAIYVLLTALLQREKRLLRSVKRKPRPWWGALLMLIGIALLMAHTVPGASPCHFNPVEVQVQEERGDLEGQVFTCHAGFPMCAQATKVPPTYSLLHPQMTTHPFSPEKKTSVLSLGKPYRKVRMRMSDKKVNLRYSMVVRKPGTK